MKSTEKVVLACENFQSNSVKLFSELREASDFCDVTLVCEDGQQVAAHKIVLSAASSVLRNMLKNNKHSHPMLFFLGIKSRDLTSLVSFIYQGEAEIYQTDLEDFLTVAKSLAVRGLSETVAVQNNEDLKQENKKFSFETQVNHFEKTFEYNYENDIQNIPSWIALREFPTMESDIEISTKNASTGKEVLMAVNENKSKVKEKQRNSNKSTAVRLETFFNLEDANGAMVASWAEKKLPGVAFCKICDSDVNFMNGGRELTKHSSTKKHMLKICSQDSGLML